jgi:tetratricopeptide (TPR) repeat protein
MALARPAARAVVPLLAALATAVGAAVLAPGRAAAQGHAHPPGSAERLGTVRFATSCSPAVAPQFDRAVALLHSFEFGASLRAFSAVLAADSTCAMAHWGIALSRWGNPMAANARPVAALRAGQAAVDAARRLDARVSERERGYVAAAATLFADHERVDHRTRVLAYERAMAALAARHPDDSEARIFHAIALTAAAPPTDKTYANQLRAGRTLEEIWTAQPDHPGLAHYIIHAYDHPPLADRARLAAQRYAQIAPAAAHALHMPSHTFTRVGAWDASVETNLRSMDAALRTNSIAEALHAADYVTYAYLQMRRLPEARAIVDSLPGFAARFDPNAVTGAAPGSAGLFALAAIPARWALERRAWAEAARLPQTTTPFAWCDAMTHFARALGAARTRDLTTARAAIDSLAADERRLREAREGYWAEQVAIQQLGARAWLARAEGRDDAALAAMREAAAREDATDKSAVTPGPLAPARELLGDLLLELGRPAEALEAYRTALRSEPNRHHTVDGARRAAEAAGDRAAAAGYAAQLRAITGG